MAESDLAERVRTLLEQGAGEAAGPHRMLPLVTLDSGARVGIDGDLRWILIPPGDGRVFVVVTPESAHLLHEALEWKRERFDDAIEAVARDLGLPADDVVFSFPVFDVVRAILAKEHPYLTRLALLWLRPTELRELRPEIKAVITAPHMPVPVRDLAERLVVPE